MIKANLDFIKSKIKFQEVGLTSRSCIGGCMCGGCGCSCAGTCKCKCFENSSSTEYLDTIYS